jgi:subtilisin family serine protease
MMRRSLVAAAGVVVFLAFPGLANAARIAVGLERGADAAAVARAVESRTGVKSEPLAPLPALVLDAPSRVSLQSLRRIPGVRYVERLGVRRVALTPTDPLVARQWYLQHSGFYSSWLTLPALEAVTVAVIDSGVDAGHPELTGRVVDKQSFVGGSARDTLGHGTFVSGLIAAGVDNGIGIAGLAPSAQLLVAKVVTPSRAIPIEAEARAIRWAVDQGAQVINMSLGGIRNPVDPNQDTYSRLEADAVAYAVSNGVVVVAAVGNGDQAPSAPWQYASYPAALPHVLGVSALTESGTVPKYSNRDRIFNDLAAPGERILSIFPRPLTTRYPQCAEQGYSSCGPDDYRSAQGTSFAAPQAAAAAAVLLSLRPKLTSDQITAVLQQSAVDQNLSTGCVACAVGRDEMTGWGLLNVEGAIGSLSEPLPRHDRFEANDDAGSRAYAVTGSTRRLFASVDFWDDQDDVYAISLRRGQSVYAGLSSRDEQEQDLSLALWLPGTRSITGVASIRSRAKVSARSGSRQYFSFRAARTGRHYVQVRITSPASARYRLTVVKG